MRNLRVVEASLTGESVPVEKRAGAVPRDASIGDRVSMAYPGMLNAFGHDARGVVVATGTATESGRIGTMMSEVRVAAALVVFQLLFTYASPMQKLFPSTALDARSWGIIAALGFAIFVAVDLEKAVWRRLGIALM